MAGIGITARAVLGAMLISFVYQAGAQTLTSQSFGGAFLVGCFGDNIDRALPFELGDTASMTPQACLQLALAAGITYESGGYFGVQFGSHCFAGNDGIHAKMYGTGGAAAPATCNMACTGNSAWACGGVWAFNLYRITTSTPRYAGCMKDGIARVLPVRLSDSGTVSVQSPERCRQLARTNNYGWYGVQNGGECWAGNSASTAVGLGPLADPPSCQVTCLGNPKEKCGGVWAHSMFHAVPADDPVNNPLPMGCVLDENAFKAGGAESAVYFGTVTAANYGLAKSTAIKAKARYFAVARAGTEGHGFVFNNTPTIWPQFSFSVGGSQGCFTPCADDASKLCGSANGFNGATAPLVWMVYRMPQATPCDGIICSLDNPPASGLGCYTPGVCSDSTGTCSSNTAVADNTTCLLLGTGNELIAGACLSGNCARTQAPGTVDGEDDMRGPQYETQEECDENCLIGAPCGAWCGCAPEKDVYGFYTCLPCLPEQLKLCADAEKRDRLIRLNTARLEAYQIREEARKAYEGAMAQLDAFVALAKQQGQASLATAGAAIAKTALAPQQEGCGRVVDGAIDGCRQGVRAQVAYCKNKKRSEIDICKRKRAAAIDACKKRHPDFPPWCERNRPGVPICEADRINVPLCEVDRINSLCCEGARGAAKISCNKIGPASVDTLIQSFQVACHVATSVAKSALKSYATGSVLGFVSEFAQIKEVAETVQNVQDLKKKVEATRQAAEGIAAAAEGNKAGALSALQGVATVLEDTSVGKLANDLASNAATTLRVAEALPALLDGKFNAVLFDAVASVTDSKIISEGLTTIKTLKTKLDAGIKTVQELKAAIDECRKAQIPSIQQLQKEFGAQLDTVEQVQVFVVKVRERYQQIGQEVGKCQQMWLSVQKLAG